MTRPIIAPQDQSKLQALETALPQSLLIVGELGLSIDSLTEHLAKTHDAQVFLIEPLPEKKTISVSQIRETITKLRTYSDIKRLVIIRTGDQMTHHSQNALLKALEEPNQDTHFIIEVHNLNQILATVISRCEVFQLHRTSPGQDESLLSNFPLDDQAKNQILFLAKGRPKLLKKLAESPEDFSLAKQMAKDAKSLFSRTTYQSFISLQAYSKTRLQAQQFIETALELTRFQVKSTGVTPQLTDMLERLYDAEKLLQNNGNAKLALLQLVV